MNLDLLALFAAVAETQSFSTAARKLGLPKSSVSRGIARLEEETGAQLLRRTTRNVSLTGAGLALYDRVAPSLASLKAALGEVEGPADTPSGELRLTAPTMLGAQLLPDLLVRFGARYPDVRVHLDLSDRMVDLVGEGYDLALRMPRRQLRSSTLVARRIAQVVGRLYASPAYVARKGLPKSGRDLEGHDWLVMAGAPKSWPLEGPETVVVRPQSRITCNDFVFARDALRGGVGIGLLPTFIAEPDVAAGTLVRILPRHTVFTGTLFLVSPAQKRVPAKVAAFRELLLETVRARPLAPRAE